MAEHIDGHGGSPPHAEQSQGPHIHSNSNMPHSDAPYPPNAERIRHGLQDFAAAMRGGKVKPEIGQFIEFARRELRTMDVEVISAVPLKPQQSAQLETHITKLIKCNIRMRTIVDPSIIGGLRVVMGNHVVDNSIKSRLEELKEALYEGVYFNNEQHAE